MPFLDLDEELEKLRGPGVIEVGRAAAGTGMRIVRRSGRASRPPRELAEPKPPTPERLAKKAASARKAYARANPEGSKRRYVRHPPGTPKHLKGDRDKARARAREYQRTVVRPKNKTIEERARQMIEERRAAFVANMEKAGVLGTVENICVGRAVYSTEYKPDVAKLYDGKEPHEVAARYDLAFFLYRVAPLSWPTKPGRSLRGWMVDRIVRETGWTLSFLIRALRDRGCLSEPDPEEFAELPPAGG